MRRASSYPSSSAKRAFNFLVNASRWTRRALLVANRGSLAISGMSSNSQNFWKAGSLPAATKISQVRVWNLEYGTRFGCGLPVAFGRLALRKKLAACGCNNAMPQSCSVMSQNCPLPDFSRSCSAIRIAIAEKRPVAISTIGVPSRVGPLVSVPLIDRHQPNHRLQDRVVARKTAKRPISPETGNTAVDQAEEALRQHVLVAESPSFHAARLEVFDQHVRIFQEPQQHFPARRL